MTIRRQGMALVALAALVLSSGCAARNIWEASRNGSLVQVKQMLDDDPDLLNAQQVDQVPGNKGNRWTPLHYAIKHRHRDIVRLLLDRGADPLVAGRSGYTSLHAAKNDGGPTIQKMVVKAIKDSGRELP